MKVKFKKRYVLGTGYPWVLGGKSPQQVICLAVDAIGLDTVTLNWPKELWDNELPQYRLVLERVGKDKK